MNWGDLRIFLAVARARRVSVAARIGRATVGFFASKTLVAGKRLRIETPEGLNGLPMLAYTSQFSLLQDAAWFQPVLSAARVILETNSTHTLLAAARASLGIAVLPRFVVRGYDDLVAISANVVERDVWLITHPEFRRDPKVRATADFLKRAATAADGLC